LWLEPLLGTILAALYEAPFLIIAMVVSARWIPKKVGLSREPRSLLAMGLGALLLQQIADLTVGVALRGISASDQLAYFATPQGLIYAILLVLFALMPLLLRATQGLSGTICS
jgi:hypothetical protein